MRLASRFFQAAVICCCVPVALYGAECGSFGTSVEFVSTPSEAARLAAEQEKLVFVLHVSGHFETPEYT